MTSHFMIQVCGNVFCSQYSPQQLLQKGEHELLNLWFAEWDLCTCDEEFDNGKVLFVFVGAKENYLPLQV